MDVTPQFVEGRGLSPGVSSGKVYLYRDLLQRDHQYYDIAGEDVAEEFLRIKQAFADVATDLEKLAARVGDELTQEVAMIFQVQRQLLHDESIKGQLEAELSSQLCNAEHVVKHVFSRLAQQMQRNSNPVMQERGADFTDLAKRLIRSLKGIKAHALERIPAGAILCAESLLPSDTVYLPRDRVRGMIVRYGGATSHAAILTRELGIPAVSGIDHLFDLVETGMPVIVDGTQGSITLNPTREQLVRAANKERDYRKRYTQARERSGEKAVTRGGCEIAVCANIGGAEDALLAQECGADAVGLFRLEMLFMRQRNLPSGQELLKVLDSALRPFDSEPATVRLLDIGADKDLPYLDLPDEANPMLGRRGIRLLLTFQDLLTLQIDTLLKLSQERNIRVLAPMVTLKSDMEELRTILEQRAQALHVDVIPPLGAMIETPAAALCVDEIISLSDFISIGTNDLTQYVMVAGRENMDVEPYYQEGHPAVLRLISEVSQAALEAGKPAEVCGEMAAGRDHIETLLSMGVRAFSVAPLAVPLVKSWIREAKI